MIAAASTKGETRLLAFITDSQIALFDLIVAADVCTHGCQLFPEKLPLPLAELEDGSVNASIVGNIFPSKGVALLVGEKANDSASAERKGSLSQSHRKTANLLTLVAKKNILDGSYRYLHNWLASLLKPQFAILNGQRPRRIVPGTFEPQKMSGANPKRDSRTGGFIAFLTK